MSTVVLDSRGQGLAQKQTLRVIRRRNASRWSATRHLLLRLEDLAQAPRGGAPYVHAIRARPFEERGRSTEMGSREPHRAPDAPLLRAGNVLNEIVE